MGGSETFKAVSWSALRYSFIKIHTWILVLVLTSTLSLYRQALRCSYSAVRDEVARLGHDVRDDAVSTVMGLAENAGTYDQNTAQNFVIKDELLTQLLDSNPQKDAILARIAQIGVAISAQSAESTAKRATQLIESVVLGPVLVRAQNIVETAIESHTNAQMLATRARKATGRVSGGRAHAGLIFTKDMDIMMLKAQMAVCNDITKTLSTLDGDLQAVVCGAGGAPPIDSVPPHFHHTVWSMCGRSVARMWPNSGHVVVTPTTLAPQTHHKGSRFCG